MPLSDELQEAVDKFFDAWKGRVTTRLEQRQEKFGEQWQEMGHAEILDRLTSEALDFTAYAIFLRWWGVTEA